MKEIIIHLQCKMFYLDMQYEITRINGKEMIWYKKSGKE